MNIHQIEKNIKRLTESIIEETFIFDFLLAYGLPKASVSRLENGDYNLSKKSKDVLWKKKIFFKAEFKTDLHVLIDDVKRDDFIIKQHPRFLIVTDFKLLLAIDTKNNDSLEINIGDLPRYFDFFLPLAGMEKTQLQSENPADIRAAERLGKLYDLILQDNRPKSKEDFHSLNVFLSRLLFCYFAEDTDIFAPKQFTNSIASHTSVDGGDLQLYLQKLFSVLNQRKKVDLPKYLMAFPYVNGGLFADDLPVPLFRSEARRIIIECGSLNWKAINPDIFGSMFQAVVAGTNRAELGMHYTSVPNIMKVIGPLFLNDLKEELALAGENKKKLKALLDRLSNIRVFDPACGSGNFLIIAFKELARLEFEVLRRLHKNQMSFKIDSVVKLDQFFGIEIDDFAAQTARLALYLSEHQMNLEFSEQFGFQKPTLPLREGGTIICGNATRIKWEEVCPKNNLNEIYILGNPPYAGARMQSKEQKSDMHIALKGIKGVSSLDYISCWLVKAANYIENHQQRCGFVSTNSITQGDQVGLLWPYIFKAGIELDFAYTSFPWSNNARGNAGVTCIIVGLSKHAAKDKFLYDGKSKAKVKNISPYLTDSSNLIIHKSTSPISARPEMVNGNQPVEGGHLTLDKVECDDLLNAHPNAQKFIRRLIGGSDFLRGQSRYCIWIENNDLEEAENISLIKERIEKVKTFRKNGGDVARSLVNRSHQFRYRHTADDTYMAIPTPCSSNRDYLPCGFFEKDIIALNSLQVIYSPEAYIFAVISSKLHMLWVKAVAGRLKTDIRYSAQLAYNTFPMPEFSEHAKKALGDAAFKVLDSREAHSEKTVAEMYSIAKMPDDLKRSHEEIDIILESCYGISRFNSDHAQLSELFKYYERINKKKV